MTQNVNVNRASGYDMLDNMPAAGLADYHDATREYKPSYERPDWRVEVVRSAALGAAVLLAWLLYAVWRLGYCWGSRNAASCERLDSAEPVLALLAIGLVVGLPAWRVALWGLAEWRLAQARAARVATTYNRWGDPQRIDVLLPLVEEARRYQLATELKRLTAPYETLHSINTYSPSNQPVKDLPAPAETLALVPPETWLAWVNEQPHTILAAETGGGKSTTAKAILAPRIGGGEQVFIIDPHSDVWFDLPIAGGGENWTEVRQALDAVSTEYHARIAEREAHRRETGAALPPEHWTRLTVLLDEAFLARVHLDTGRKGEVTPWEGFTKVLGSGARKVRISILLLTQSANVEDLGLSGALRENFLRVALDSASARKLVLAEEASPERRKLLLGALEGQQYPAVCEYRGQVYALDRTGLDRVPAPRDARRAAWCPPLVAPAAADDATLEILRSLRAAGWTRKEVRASGLQFDNDLWAQAES